MTGWYIGSANSATVLSRHPMRNETSTRLSTAQKLWSCKVFL